MHGVLSAVAVELGHVLDAIALQMHVDSHTGSRAVGRALLYAERAVKRTSRAYQRVVVQLLSSHAIRLPSRESMSFASLVFSVRGALEDIRLLSTGVDEFGISHDVVLHGVVPDAKSMRAVSSRRRHRYGESADV
jgi:hypothetical protein